MTKASKELSLVVSAPLSDYRGRSGYPKLDRAWRLDVCKDGTLSIRRRGQRSINKGHALSVYSTDTRDEAIALQVLLCFSVHAKHPDLPDGEWYKLNDVRNSPHRAKAIDIGEFIPVFEIEDHQAVAWKIADVAELLRARKAAREPAAVPA